MNLTQTSHLYEAFCDLAETRIEREDSIAEAKQRYIDRRAEEIHERRTVNVSNEDFIIALERLSTLPELMKLLQARVYEEDQFLACYMQGAVKAALYYDSVDLARTEANALFDESASQERH